MPTIDDDQYAWVGGITGDWQNANNWQDLTTSANPAPIPPGSNDAVTFGPTGTAVRVVSGTGNALSITVGGATNLQGQFATSALTVTGVTLGIVGVGDSLTVSGNITETFGTSATALVVNGATLSAGTLTQSGTLPRLAASLSVLMPSPRCRQQAAAQ